MRWLLIVLIFALAVGCGSDAQAGKRDYADLAEMMIQMQVINQDPDIPIMFVPSPIFYKVGLFGKRQRVALQMSPVVKAQYIVDKLQPVQAQPVPTQQMMYTMPPARIILEVQTK